MNHDVLLGLPDPGNADKDELRVFLVKRVPYVLTDAEAPANLVALVDGAIPQVIGWHRTWFWYDPFGGITSVDLVTVIQTQDGFIYKADSSDLDIHSVLDRNLATPPVSPAIGAAYLVAAGPTGAWAGRANDLALYTERGWVLIEPRIGDWVLVEDEDVYVRYKPDGTWAAGQGSAGYGANSIPHSALINVDPLRVENQTTNTPPGSPVVPVAYIVGSAPTGVWTGHTKKIAKCELNGTWTIYTPLDGQRAYDKTLLAWYQWDSASSTWRTASGAFVLNIRVFTANGTYSKSARLIGIIATVTGGGGAASGTSGNGSAGGTSSLGSLLSATGGAGGIFTSGDGAAGGVGSGGDINYTGNRGAWIASGVADGSKFMSAHPGVPTGNYGIGGRPVGEASFSNAGGGGGGTAIEWLTNTELATNETVTIGAGGTAVSGEAGTGGIITIIEYIEA